MLFLLSFALHPQKESLSVYTALCRSFYYLESASFLIYIVFTPFFLSQFLLSRSPNITPFSQTFETYRNQIRKISIPEDNIDDVISRIYIIKIIYKNNIHDVISKIFITEVIYQGNIDEIISKTFLTEVIYQGHINEIIGQIFITDVIYTGTIDKV
jgi:hypothetical protein